MMRVEWREARRVAFGATRAVGVGAVRRHAACLTCIAHAVPRQAAREAACHARARQRRREAQRGRRPAIAGPSGGSEGRVIRHERRDAAATAAHAYRRGAVALPEQRSPWMRLARRRRSAHAARRRWRTRSRQSRRHGKVIYTPTAATTTTASRRSEPVLCAPASCAKEWIRSTLSL